MAARRHRRLGWPGTASRATPSCSSRRRTSCTSTSSAERSASTPCWPPGSPCRRWRRTYTGALVGDELSRPREAAPARRVAGEWLPGATASKVGVAASCCGRTATRSAIASCSVRPTIPSGRPPRSLAFRRRNDDAPMIAGLLRTGRPKQWLKNVLVFAAPGAAGVLDDGTEPGPGVRWRSWRSAWRPAARTSGTTCSTSSPTGRTRRSATDRSRPASSRSRPPAWSASCSSPRRSGSPPSPDGGRRSPSWAPTSC